MRSIVEFLAGVAAVMALAVSPAHANDRAIVDAFYTQLMSDASAPDVPARAQKILAANWESIGDYSGKIKSRDAFVGQVQGLGKLIPDLKFAAQDVIQQGNRFIVRGRATGTPNGPFFGVPATGKSFDIMSIDIHTVQNGLIVKSYHVEDWAAALRQLTAK